MPSLRESLTSSSSNSTVKEAEKAASSGKQKRKKRLSPTPPSPPPRKSSQKFNKSRSDDEEASPSKSLRPTANPVMASLVNETAALLTSLSESAPQTAKKMPPARPSRDGIPSLEAPLDESRTVIQSNLIGLPFPADRRRSVGYQVKSPPKSGQVEESPRPSMSKIPSRDHPPSPVQRQSSGSTSAPSGLGIIPDLRPVANQTHQQRQIPASRTRSLIGR